MVAPFAAGPNPIQRGWVRHGWCRYYTALPPKGGHFVKAVYNLPHPHRTQPHCMGPQPATKAATIHPSPHPSPPLQMERRCYICNFMHIQM